jgi:serine/threonine protein kinase
MRTSEESGDAAADPLLGPNRMDESSFACAAYFSVIDDATRTDMRMRIQKQIGTGTHASVFASTLHKPNAEPQAVALKLCLREGDHSVLLRESSIWERLAHPHVAELHGYFSTPTHWGMVSELFLGGSLENRHANLRTEGAPPPTAVALVDDMRQVASAMEYLHGLTPEPVIHRDLKAANILVQLGGRLAVSDFGVARLRAPDGQAMTGETGTYRWMAPEVSAHAHCIDCVHVRKLSRLCSHLAVPGTAP